MTRKYVLPIALLVITLFALIVALLTSNANLALPVTPVAVEGARIATEVIPEARVCTVVEPGTWLYVVEGDCVTFTAIEVDYYALGVYGGSLMLMSEEIGMALEPNDIQLIGAEESVTLNVVLKRTGGPGQQSIVFFTNYDDWMGEYQNFLINSAAVGPLTIMNAAGLVCDPRSGITGTPYCGS